MNWFILGTALVMGGCGYSITEWGTTSQDQIAAYRTILQYYADRMPERQFFLDARELEWDPTERVMKYPRKHSTGLITSLLDEHLVAGIGLPTPDPQSPQEYWRSMGDREIVAFGVSALHRSEEGSIHCIVYRDWIAENQQTRFEHRRYLRHMYIQRITLTLDEGHWVVSNVTTLLQAVGPGS